MALITFLSDFGESDHYVAAVKAKILTINPEAKIIDISHQIASCDIAHAAYVLRAVYKDFPKGTIHIVAVNTVGQQGDKYIALSIEDHHFIGTDNGIFGLISDQEASTKVNLEHSETTTFPAKQVFAPAAAKLAAGANLEEVGSPIKDYKRMLARHLKANKKQIAGHVIRVDHYGNLITNIERTPFDILSKGKRYSITFGRENIPRIHENVYHADAGDVFLIFNDQGYLEIGINQGNASELLGLHYDSPVTINFEE